MQMCTGLRRVLHCVVTGLVLVFSPASPVSVIWRDPGSSSGVGLSNDKYLSQASSGAEFPLFQKAAAIERLEPKLLVLLPSPQAIYLFFFS